MARRELARFLEPIGLCGLGCCHCCRSCSWPCFLVASEPGELEFEPEEVAAIEGEEPTGPPDVILVVLDEPPSVVRGTVIDQPDAEWVVVVSPA
jgi:hypothetical protein